MGAIEQVFQNLIDSNRDRLEFLQRNEHEQPNARSVKRRLSLASSTPGQGLAKRTKKVAESTPGQDMNSMSVNQGIHRSTRSQPDANVVWTLTPHGEQPILFHKVLLEFQRLELVAVLRDSANNQLEKIKLEALKEIAWFIDLYDDSKKEYREIIYNPDYQEIYGMRPREVLKVDENGNEYKEILDTGVCQECRIVLPWKNLTVDHQRPQKGGSYEATLKTFRALGLTQGGPKGHKGNFIQVKLQSMFKHASAEFRVPANAEFRVPANLTERYKLNNKGIIFFTLIYRQRCYGALYDACLHGLLNLKPLCNICNSEKGDKGIKFPKIK